MRTFHTQIKLDEKPLTSSELLTILLTHKSIKTSPSGTIRFIDDPANKDIVANANKHRSDLVNDFIQHATEISDHSKRECLIKDVLDSKNALGQILHSPTSSLKFFIGGLFSKSKDHKKTTNSIADISLFFIQHLYESLKTFIENEKRRLNDLDQKSDQLFINAFSQITVLANNIDATKPGFKKDLFNTLTYLDTFTRVTSKSDINKKNWDEFKTIHSLALAHIHFALPDEKAKLTLPAKK
jgi:hypothetical protein